MLSLIKLQKIRVNTMLNFEFKKKQYVLHFLSKISYKLFKKRNNSQLEHYSFSYLSVWIQTKINFLT